MNIEQRNQILNEMIELLELPVSSYEKAKKRYEDLGDWFSRPESTLKLNQPHIFPQGSFRIGTAIKPINESKEYDLDLACKLQNEINISSCTQEKLKAIIGKELELYRSYRGIKKRLESKHRCWRLEYQDDISFHIDIVPCLPADIKKCQLIQESIKNIESSYDLGKSISQTTVFITDDRHEHYREICDDWNISNPEGYAKWFEHRMNIGKRKGLHERAQIDDLPLYSVKSPLQRVIQILKRHRDIMFKDSDDLKPISMIITTLAAKSYNGELNIYDAFSNIITRMGNYINQYSPYVPNPVDPQEDFADRWDMQQYRHLRLRDNFFKWLYQVKIDFETITSDHHLGALSKMISEKFSLDISESRLAKYLDQKYIEPNLAFPEKQVIDERDQPRPWRF